MPAYDRPIHFQAGASSAPVQPTAVGSVVIFKSTDVERVQAWLDRAAEAGIIEKTYANTYNPTYGGPVWYVP